MALVHDSSDFEGLISTSQFGLKTYPIQWNLARIRPLVFITRTIYDYIYFPSSSLHPVGDESTVFRSGVGATGAADMPFNEFRHWFLSLCT